MNEKIIICTVYLTPLTNIPRIASQRPKPRRPRSASGNGGSMASNVKNMEVTDVANCACCGAPRSEWEYCDLCRPKICGDNGHDL
jgi:hypothetical protein